MQIKLFTIPVADAMAIEDEVNRFLRGKRVIELHHEFVHDGGNSCWCFLIKYLEGEAKDQASKGRTRERKDYKDILSPETFARFVRLRAIRKQLAEEDGVPAFALFTDEQMAELAKAEVFTVDAMAQVSGIGAGRVERYGERIEAHLKEEKGQP